MLVNSEKPLFPTATKGGFYLLSGSRLWY